MTYNPAAQAATPQLFSAVDNITNLPLAGGELYTYASGTITPQATFTDNTLTVPMPNPIILDNYGQAIFWLSDVNYRYNLINAAGIQQAHYPQDNIQPQTTATFAAQLAASANTSQGQGLVGFNPSLTYASGTLPGTLASSGVGIGSALVGFLQVGTGAVPRNIQSRDQERLSVKDFGAYGDNIHDDTAAIQAAINQAMLSSNPAIYGTASPSSGPCEVFFPSGWYKISSALVIGGKVSIKGEGQSESASAARIFQSNTNADTFLVSCNQAQGMSCSFENITMWGISGGTGNHVHIVKGAGVTNSIRIIGCTFSTPPTFSINAEETDDLIIDRCLFDDSSGYAIALGTNVATNCVSNCRIVHCNFFHIPTTCISIFNVINLIINANVVSHDAGVTQSFIDAVNTTPYQLNDIHVSNNMLTSCNVLIQAGYGSSGGGQSNLSFVSNTCPTCGNAAGSTNIIYTAGTWTGVFIEGNSISGANGTYAWIQNAGTVTASGIMANRFNVIGGSQTVACLGALSGFNIENNSFSGFTVHSVSEKWFTSGNMVSPGVVTTLNSNSVNLAVSGAAQGDSVILCATSTSWFCPPGITVSSFISAANTVTLSYTNSTAGSIGVPAHDVGIIVLR